MVVPRHEEGRGAVIEAPWDKVRDLLDSALELPAEARSNYLDEHCSDPNVRRSVEALIESYEESATFLEQPAAHSFIEQDQSWTNRILGPYKLLNEIGAGGMGVVYRATRADDEYQQFVAVKIVNGIFVSKQLVDHFRSERQILANLNHPNVARLLHGGTTPEGLPYLVMEFVEGIPIDEYCDRHLLSLNARLDLFTQLCSAIQYAHQNLIVHRDLKPGNILVTAEGIPKLLDFGIAKILNPIEQRPRGERTITLQSMMTPAYASPEQLRGEQISTASDVYALGVLLYVLLTGHGPYKLDDLSHEQVVYTVCETEPVRPSEMPGRIGDRVDPGGPITPTAANPKLRRQLAGDLDNIVLKALRKEPERRYSSVEQFVEDIRRHLKGLPVRARRDTLWYRTEKFVKRNKVAVLAAMLLLFSLCAGMTATMWEAHIARLERARAERRFNDVRGLANSLLFDVHDSIRNLPGATPARELIVKKALAYLDSLAQEASNDATLQRELGTAYEKVGDVQGQFVTENLGQPEAALQSYRKALAIRTALVQADPRDIENRRQLATIYGKLSNIQWLIGDPQTAFESARKGLELSQSVSASNPANRSDRKLLATSYLDYGWKQAAGLGDYPSGIVSCQQAIAILEELLQQDASDKDARTSLTTAYSRLGTFLESVNRFPEALAAFRTALTMREKLLAEDPTNVKNVRYASSSHINIGNVLAEMDDPRGALSHQQTALAMFQSLSVDDPINVQLRQDRAGVLGNIGSLLTIVGNEVGAERSLQEALTLLLNLPAANSSVVIRFTIAKDQYRLGKAFASQAAKTADPATSKEHWREARVWFEKSLPVLIDLRDRKIAQGSDAALPDEILKEISNCDNALRK